jgi:hypothetical protein
MSIASRADLTRYLAADVRAHGVQRLTFAVLVKNPALRWQRLYRRAEYARTCWTGLRKPAAVLLQLLLLRRSVRLGSPSRWAWPVRGCASPTGARSW